MDNTTRTLKDKNNKKMNKLEVKLGNIVLNSPLIKRENRMIQENISLQPNEEIRPIQGYEGIYSITSFGRVWSHKRYVKNGKSCRECGGYFLKSSMDKYGYVMLSLYKEYKKNYPRLHRLVAQQFIENPLNLLQINYKDGNKQNNHVSNLEWCTLQENHNHAAINKLYKHKKTSRYYGVYFKFDKRRKKWWVAHIQYNSRKKEIGRFLTEIEAAIAYNKYIFTYNLNKPLNRI